MRLNSVNNWTFYILQSSVNKQQNSHLLYNYSMFLKHGVFCFLSDARKLNQFYIKFQTSQRITIVCVWS